MNTVEVLEPSGTVVVLQQGVPDVVEVVDRGPQGPVGEVNTSPLTGLVLTDDTPIQATNTVLIALGRLQAQISGSITTAINAVLSALNLHKADMTNPHAVTKAQVGLANVDNTSDANKPVSTATATALAGKQASSAVLTFLAGATAATAAAVKTLLALVKADVGLGNVDNTSDANKPVSTAQQAALDLKASISGSTGVLQVPHGTTAQRTTALGVGIRRNDDTGQFEGYSGSAWGSIGGGAEGGGPDRIFLGSDATMTTDYTLPNGRNYVVPGPLVLNATLTFGDGVVTFV